MHIHLNKTEHTEFLMTEKSERTKKALIKAANNLIKASGNASSITLRQIARASKMSPSLIKYHFGDKAGLMEAVLKQSAPIGNINPITQFLKNNRALLDSGTTEEKVKFITDLVDFVANYFKDIRTTPWLQCIHTRVVNIQKVSLDTTVPESADDVQSFCDIYKLITGKDDIETALNWFLVTFVPLAFHVCSNTKTPSIGSVVLTEGFGKQYVEFIKHELLSGCGLDKDM